jgi:hypothetical protein
MIDRKVKLTPIGVKGTDSLSLADARLSLTSVGEHTKQTNRATSSAAARRRSSCMSYFDQTSEQY